MEILQLALQQPEVAVLDETDSGLDIDALRVVANGVNSLAQQSEMGVLIITHYQRILHLVQPDFVHVLYDGRIVKEGGPELVTASRRRATAGSATRWRRARPPRHDDRRRRTAGSTPRAIAARVPDPRRGSTTASRSSTWTARPRRRSRRP